MKTKRLIRSIVVPNQWTANPKYHGPLGRIRKWRKGRLERALAFKIKIGDREEVLDLSLMGDSKYGLYLFANPIEWDPRLKLHLSVIPPDSDLAPIGIKINAEEVENAKNGVV